MPTQFLDAFHRALNARLQEETVKRMEALAGGSATTTPESTSTVGERYAAQTSYIAALNDVVKLCVEVEETLYGARRPDGDDNG